ncbi:MAG: hypothetical protein ACLP5E_07315 [Streptosporangiaceae bacterium]
MLRTALLGGAAAALASCAGTGRSALPGPAAHEPHRPGAGAYDFNQDWLFGGGYRAGSADPGYDDSGFTPVTLPHTVTPLSWGNWDPSRWEQVWIYRKYFGRPGRPGDRVFVDFDEIGLMVWAEPPGWQYVGDATWQDLAVGNTRDMVLRDRNRPSVIVWATRLNETANYPGLYTRTRRVARDLDGLGTGPAGRDAAGRAPAVPLSGRAHPPRPGCADLSRGAGKSRPGRQRAGQRNCVTLRAGYRESGSRRAGRSRCLPRRCGSARWSGWPG